MNEEELRIVTDYTLKLIEFNNSRIQLVFTVFVGTLLAGILIANIKTQKTKPTFLSIMFALLAISSFVIGVEMIRVKLKQRNLLIHKWCGVNLNSGQSIDAQKAIGMFNAEYYEFQKEGACLCMDDPTTQKRETFWIQILPPAIPLLLAGLFYCLSVACVAPISDTG